ncbi:MAG: TPD domain-containing protein [Candidatus Helarchaeota archaeon]
MKSIEFAKYCQNLIEQVKKNYWRLSRLSPNDLKNDVLFLAEKTKTSPVIVLKYKLKLQGFTKKQINKILTFSYPNTSQNLKNEILIAIYNDPVYSPLGIRITTWRGKEGEEIINEWLKSRSIKFVRDPGNDKIGKPDFLLDNPIKINNKEVKWIESKCSYGSYIEQKNNLKQFNKFDNIYGMNGCIIYWYGFKVYKNMKNRFMLNWKDMMNIVPKYLHPRIKKLVFEIPEEFEYIIDY